MAPCTTEAMYVTTPSTIMFGADHLYTPKCLKISKAAAVTWSGTFSHPLLPSNRGTSGNPITSTSTGTTKMFTFPNAGFFPYYCQFHGDNAGANMAGVIWVE